MPSVRRVAVTCLALLCTAAFAQSTVTYVNGEASNTPRVTTPANPLTLSLASGNATEAGAISGNGTVTKTGAGTLTLSNAGNSFTGGITVSGGTLRALSTNLTLAGGPIQIAAGATFDFDDFGLRLDKVTGNGTVTGGDFEDMLFVGNSTPVATYLQFDTPSNLSVVTGDLTLARNNTFAGGIATEAGILRIKHGTAISADWMYVANDGPTPGLLTLETGAMLTLTHAGTSYVRGSFSATGDGTRLTSNGTLAFGENGPGDAVISSGAEVTARNLQLGSWQSTNNVTISGAGTRLSASNDLSIGVGGTVDVVLTAGATLRAENSFSLGSGGTLNVGARALSPAAAAGLIDTAQISGDGILQLNTPNSAAAPLYLTRNGTATGMPIELSGAIRLVQNAGYTVATGNMALGDSSINHGTFQFGGTGAETTLSGNIVNQGELRLRSGTFTGRLTGTGQIIIPTGNTTNLMSARIEAPLTLQGTLVATALESRVNLLSGPGDLKVDLGGQLILLGQAAHTGSTTVVDGTLQIGEGGASGSMNGPIANNGTVAFARADDFTHTGAISGNGGVNQMGPGNLTLGGNYTYTGSTTVLLGNVTLAPGATFTGGGALYLESGTRFDAGNRPGGLVLADVGGSGDFTMAGGGNLTLNTATDLSISATLSGAFDLRKEGPGTLQLNAANNITGNTTVAAGKLSISSPSGLPSGDLINNGVVEFATTTNLTRTISGSGSVRVISGTLTIDAPQTYTGPTVLAGGTLNLSPQGSLTSEITIDPTSFGFVDLTGSSLNMRLTNPTAASQITLGSGSLTIEQTLNTTTGTRINGSGTTRKEGPAKLTVTGFVATANTVVAAGTLQIGNGGNLGSISGNVVNDGTLVFSRSDSAAFTVNISGSGSFTQVGPGTLTLTGNQTYTGPTLVSGGLLRMSGSGSLLTGNVTIAAGAQFAPPVNFVLTRITADSQGTIGAGSSLTYNSTSDFTLPVPTNGAGALTVTGGGTLRTAANLAHTGVTTIAANSTLEIGTGGTTGTLTSNVTNQGTLVFNRTNSLTYAGRISGAGSLRQAGTGTLTLTSPHTFAGNTTVSAGTLALAAGSSIAASARITLASGATLDTTGLVNGLTLASGQRLDGTGRVVGALTAGNGSRLAPGNSPGTLTFENGLTLADGSILDLELGTTSDLLRITGGTLTGSTTAGRIRLNVTDAGGFAAGAYTLFDFTGATTSSFDLSDFTFGTMPTGYTYALSFVGSTLRLTATAIAAPTIVTPPADAVVAAGGSAAFSVVVTGNPAPTFQWRRNGTALAGATSSGLTFPSAALANAGTYDVVVTNSAGSVTSAGATLRFTQSITFPTVAGLTFPRSAPVALSASASSGLEVTFAVVSGPGTLSGNQLTLTGAGTVVVRAAQAGDSTYAAATADQSFVATLDGFANWQSTSFNAAQLADPAISGELADPDRDGLVNLAEYALGLDPLTSDAQVRVPAVSWDGTNWMFTWIRPTDRPDITYTAETSADLASWSSTGLTPSLVNRTGGFDTWRVSVPVGTARRQFFRLVFTR